MANVLDAHRTVSRASRGSASATALSDGVWKRSWRRVRPQGDPSGGCGGLTAWMDVEASSRVVAAAAVCRQSSRAGGVGGVLCRRQRRRAGRLQEWREGRRRRLRSVSRCYVHRQLAGLGSVRSQLGGPPASVVIFFAQNYSLASWANSLSAIG